MRSFFLFILLSANLICHAQKIEKYFDWNWKECDVSKARFYREAHKTDSGWRCIDYFVSTTKSQMVGLYKDEELKIANGQFTFFYASGKIKSFGRYKNDKHEGIWLNYHPNGMMADSTVYNNGEATGISLGWNSNGYISDSVIHGSNGIDVFYNWFDNGVPSAAGRMIKGKLQGVCQYFHKNGIIAAREKYDDGQILERIYYDEAGNPEKDTASKDIEAEFKSGTKGWSKFVQKNIYFPDREYKIENTDSVTVVVTATINEEGKVADAYVELPFHQRFDDIALIIFKRSPDWFPAVSHNRPVKQIVRQGITFIQNAN